MKRLLRQRLGYRNSHLAVLICLVLLLLNAFTSAAEEPIKIGAIFALSGKAKNSNLPAVLGVHLAVEEINHQGGILGTPLALLLFDNESTPIGSHLAAEKAALAGVAGIIGASWSSHSLAIAKVAQQRNIPMISPISTIPALTAIGDYIFRVCYTDTLQGALLAQFASRELQAKSALVFVDISSDFSLNIAQIFKTNFTKLGGTVSQEIEYKTGQADYSSQISLAITENTDIIFLAGYDESGFIAAKLQEAGDKAIPIGSDGWDAESFFTLGGNKIRQGYYINHWSPAHNDALSLTFLAKYGSLGEIKAPTVLAYDAVNMLVAAIRLAESLDHEAIRHSLAGLRGFKGVTGEITFGTQGDALKSACIIEIRDGLPIHRNCYLQPQP
ncbi:MAG: ABC transporter substrate-binding protein [Proteobacteria bacterium]|nr:ABC transporter substrate-binding protein [Pseudomonadota bacterium]